jgi:hypothetical protein
MKAYGVFHGALGSFSWQCFGSYLECNYLVGRVGRLCSHANMVFSLCVLGKSPTLLVFSLMV